MGRIMACVISIALLPAIAAPAQKAGGPIHVSAEDSPSSMLAWTPSALTVLGQQAEVRNSFVLDRTTLGAMLALLPRSDDQVRPAIRKLDGISVHLYRFHDLGQIDPAELQQVRAAYGARGWKHMVSEGGSEDSGRKKTDLWLALDGVEVRGGAMMLVTPKSVSVVTFVGDLNPIDLLHLRGHFGIPSAKGDEFSENR
jgi:hypothetical protein